MESQEDRARAKQRFIEIQVKKGYDIETAQRDADELEMYIDTCTEKALKKDPNLYRDVIKEVEEREEYQKKRK